MSTSFYDVRDDLQITRTGQITRMGDTYEVFRVGDDVPIAMIRLDAAEVLLGLADRDRCCARRSGGGMTIHRAPVRGYVISEYGEPVRWEDILREHDDRRGP